MSKTVGARLLIGNGENRASDLTILLQYLQKNLYN